jgi:hypothetical protein
MTRPNLFTTIADGRLADGRPHCYVADPFGNRIELIEEIED